MLKLIGRNNVLFAKDIANYENELSETVQASHFLVIGSTGLTGVAITYYRE